MKGFIAVLAMGLVACVQGQDVCADAIAKIPDCARPCIADAAGSVGCTSQDLKCQCDPSKSAAIASAAIGCVLKGCGIEQGLLVSSAGLDVCACAATAVPAPASATPAASTTPAVEASTTPESSAAPTTTKAVATSKGSTSPPFPTGSASRSGSSPATASGTAPGVSATKSSHAAAYTGAAVQAVGSVGGVLGALFVAIWAL